MIFPYLINKQAIDEFMTYHKIKNEGEVGGLLGMSDSYYSLLLGGKRKLTEEVRLRLQHLTRKPQDELFLPNYEAMPFTHQSLAMGKFYGLIPYDKYSISEAFRNLDLGPRKRKPADRPASKAFWECEKYI